MFGEEPTFQLQWSRAAKQTKLPLQERIRVKVPAAPDVSAHQSSSVPSHRSFLPRMEGTALQPSELAAQQALEAADREAETLRAKLADLRRKRQGWQGNRRLEASRIQSEAKTWHLRRDALFHDVRQAREDTVRLERETKEAEEARKGVGNSQEDRAAELEQELAAVTAEVAAAEAAVSEEERLANDPRVQEGADARAAERKDRLQELSAQVVALEQQLYESRPHQLAASCGEDGPFMDLAERAAERLLEQRRNLLMSDVLAWVQSRKEAADSRARRLQEDAVLSHPDAQAPVEVDQRSMRLEDETSPSRPPEIIGAASAKEEGCEDEVPRDLLRSVSDEGPGSPSGMGSEASLHGEEAAEASLARGLLPPVLPPAGAESSTAFQSDVASVVSGLERSLEDVQQSAELDCHSLEIVPGQDQALARDLVEGALEPIDTADNALDETAQQLEPSDNDEEAPVLNIEERSRQLGWALFMARQELSGSLQVRPAIEQEDSCLSPDARAVETLAESSAEIRLQESSMETSDDIGDSRGWEEHEQRREGSLEAMLALRLDIPEKVHYRADRSESEQPMREAATEPSPSMSEHQPWETLISKEPIGDEGTAMQHKELEEIPLAAAQADERSNPTSLAGSRPASAMSNNLELYELSQTVPPSPGAASASSRLDGSIRASTPEPAMSRLTSNRSVAEDAIMRKLSTPPSSRPASAARLQLPSPKAMERIQSSPPRVERLEEGGSGVADPPELFRPTSATTPSVSAHLPGGPAPRYRRPLPAALAD